MRDGSGEGLGMFVFLYSIYVEDGCNYITVTGGKTIGGIRRGWDKGILQRLLRMDRNGWGRPGRGESGQGEVKMNHFLKAMLSIEMPWEKGYN